MTYPSPPPCWRCRGHHGAATPSATPSVYVLFDDDTDLYWARARGAGVSEPGGSQSLAGAQPQLGPDATGVGWSTSTPGDKSGKHDPQRAHVTAELVSGNTSCRR